MKNNNQKFNYQTTQFDIPKFSYKSAFIIATVVLLNSLLAIYAEYQLKVPFKTSLLLLLPISVSLTISYCLFYLDKKKGSIKNFFSTFFILFIMFSAIVFFLDI